MNNYTQLSLEIARCQQNISFLLDKVCADIEALPDNPNIIRSGGSCFSVNFQFLPENLSPAYHDFKHQYKLITNEMRKADTIVPLAKLEFILETGKVTGIKLNPAVIHNIKSLLDSE